MEYNFDNYYRTMYKTLHIYKKEHVSYRYFKKKCLKRLNEYKKMLNDVYKYVNMDNITILRKGDKIWLGRKE